MRKTLITAAALLAATLTAACGNRESDDIAQRTVAATTRAAELQIARTHVEAGLRELELLERVRLAWREAIRCAPDNAVRAERQLEISKVDKEISAHKARLRSLDREIEQLRGRPPAE